MNRFWRIDRLGATARRALAYVAIGATVVTAAVAVPPGDRAEAAPTPLLVLVDDIVQRDSDAYDAWRSLEAEARETVAAMRDVPNDTRLAWFARDEIRAVMFARLVSAIQAKASGATLSPNEAAWVDATTALVQKRRVAAAQSALDEYDRWDVDPCSYQPPAGYGFKEFAPCGVGLGSLADPLAPSADQFTAYGTALNLDRVLLDPDARASELAVVQALTLLGGVSAALLAGAAAGALALLVPAVATTVAIAMGTWWGGFAVGAALAPAFASGVLATGVGIAVFAAVVTAIGIWQLVLSEQVRPTLVDRLTAAQDTAPDLGALTSDDGLGELFSLFLGQTLPDQSAERAAAVTPTPYDALNDPMFRDVATGDLLPQLRTIDWNGRAQTTYISGRWFVTATDGGSFEWDATLQFRGGDGVNASAIIGPTGFVSAQRTSDTNFVARNSNQLWVSDPDVVGASRSVTFAGNTPPSIGAVRLTGNPTRPDFTTLLEGERLVFGVTATDAEDVSPPVVQWFLPPDGGGAFAEACTPADGALAPLFRCVWDVRTGARVDPVYTRSGTYFGRVRATDSRGASDEQWFTFTVTNVAPSLTVDQLSSSTITVKEGMPITFSGRSSDPGDDQLRISVDWGDGTVQSQSYPCAGPVAADGTCTAAILGSASDPTSWSRTRTYPRPGEYTVTITADDFQGGSMSTTRQVVVTASTVSVDQPIVTTNGSTVDLFANVRSFDTPFRITVDWGDGTTTTADAPCTGDGCAFGAVGPSNGIIVLCVAMGERCTWFRASHTYARAGDYTITVTPSRPEVGLTFTARTSSVSVVNSAPTAVFNPSQPCPTGGVVICLPIPDPDTRDVTIGSAVRLRGQVVDNTPDTLTGTIDWGDGTVEAVSLDAAAWGGACTLTSPCSPNARFFDASHTYAAAGDYTVTFAADDGDGGTTDVTTRVTVRPNASPIVVDDTIRTNEDVGTFAFAAAGLLSNDRDPENDPVQVVDFTQPTNGTVTVAADGGYSFTPDRDANGTSSFTYTVSDGRTSSTGTVTVEIVAVNDPPEATGPVGFTLFEDGTVCLFGCPTVLGRFRDVENDPLVAELVTPPANGTLSPALTSDGTFGYVPATDWNGRDTFVFRVCERDRATVCTQPVTATLDVTAVNDAPSFVAGPSRTATTDSGTVTVPGWATAISPGPADESTQRVSFTVVATDPSLFAPGGLPAVSADGTLTFRPVAVGSTQVSVVAVDDGSAAAPGRNRSAAQTFTVAVTAPVSRFAPMVSTSNQRTSPVLLDGATVSGPIAVFVPAAADIARVEFFLDDPTMSRRPRTIEYVAPYDFAGTTSTGRATMFSTRRLSDGPHSITARVVLRNGTTQVVTASFTVSNPRPATRRLMVSTQTSRAGGLPLDGGRVSGPVAVYVPDEAGIVAVEFRVDGRFVRVESARPWDLGSTLRDGRAALVRFSPGTRTVTARIVFSDGFSDTIQAVFTAS